jgi:hypothetical protein
LTNLNEEIKNARSGEIAKYRKRRTNYVF